MSLSHFTVPARPEDEARRLLAVTAYQIDRDIPDPTLDAIVSETATLFGVPIAMISIVTDEQQCFPACVGLDVTSTSRSISFCGHAILTADTMIVPNALEDPRFAGNPLVVSGPQIRFYAGTPLISPEGFAIGTLCIVDARERRFDSSQVTMLKGQASRVMTRLNERRGGLS
jgi:GAF domain-containing protein